MLASCVPACGIRLFDWPGFRRYLFLFEVVKRFGKAGLQPNVGSLDGVKRAEASTYLISFDVRSFDLSEACRCFQAIRVGCRVSSLLSLGIFPS
jgi:hypothetical protein